MEKQITDYQLEIFTGSMLGDGYMVRPQKSSYNWRFFKKQRTDKKEYLDWHFVKFGNHSCSILPQSNRLRFKCYEDNPKSSHSFVFSTHAHKTFTCLAKTWYENANGTFSTNNGKIVKIVPKDIKLTPLTVAIWFCDDGTHEPKDRKMTICTNGFTTEECEFLRTKLNVQFNLRTSLRFHKNQPQIYIPPNSYLDFINVISPHMIWDCYKYKIDLSNYVEPLATYGETHYLAKLTYQDTCKIKSLHAQGVLQKDIATMFKVSKSCVCNIVNGKRWTKATSLHVRDFPVESQLH
jgi:hypothetical protein